MGSRTVEQAGREARAATISFHVAHSRSDTNAVCATSIIHHSVGRVVGPSALAEQNRLSLPLGDPVTNIMIAMRFVIAVGFLLSGGLAFAPRYAQCSCASKLPLRVTTSATLPGQARPAVGTTRDDEDDRPKLFDDSIYADIASAYEKLDKRFKEGPGTLTADELQDLEAELTRIGQEMRENQHKRPARPATRTTTEATPPSQVSQPAPTISMDSNTAPEHEGPNGFDGKFGVPQGTRNTYVIEGMEEMTPEEYQVAIQEAVSARQRQRRASGVVGNQTSQNYLNNLGK